MNFAIKKVSATERDWVLEVARSWGADFVVTKGRKVYIADIDGYYAEDDGGKKVGLVTYEITGDQCEVVTLDAFEKFSGIGTALMDRVRQTVTEAGCKRLWLLTTNDNLDALRFYQKRGFQICAINFEAIEESRRMKQSIPLTGCFGIPIRDEIELEMMLG